MNPELHEYPPSRLERAADRVFVAFIIASILVLVLLVGAEAVLS